MWKLFSYLVLITMTSLALSSKACDCGNSPTDFLSTVRQVFIAYQTAHVSTDALVITKGVMVGITSNQKGVRYEVLKQYLGRTYSDTVAIWGSDGNDCRWNTPGFFHLPADTIVLLMKRNIHPDYPYEDTADFYSSYCGVHYMIVRNDSVFGGYPGTFAWNGFPLAPFEDSLNHLLHTLGIESTAATPFPVSLFPNPVSTMEGLHLQGNFHDNLTVSIYDLTGRVISTAKHSFLASDKTISISIRGLSSGQYFLRLASDIQTQCIPFTAIQ